MRSEGNATSELQKDTVTSSGAGDGIRPPTPGGLTCSDARNDTYGTLEDVPLPPCEFYLAGLPVRGEDAAASIVPFRIAMSARSSRRCATRCS